MTDLFMQSIGWVGHLMFALSAIPQAALSYRQGHSKGISGGLLFMWGTGETLAIIYGLYESLPMQLMVNYILNWICLAVIVYYYVHPRKDKHEI